MRCKYLNNKFLLLYFVGVTILSCGTSREVSTEDLARLDTIIKNQYFEVQAQWAMPLATNALNQLANAGLFRPGDNASQINLQGNSNYFKFEGDTVSADLPYYGERQMGGSYNRNTGIEFKGVPKDLKITNDSEKNRYNINFTINDETENYQVSLTLYPNLNALIYVNSSQRNSINYRGNLKDLDTQKEKE